jgi:hypothetical protein
MMIFRMFIPPLINNGILVFPAPRSAPADQRNGCRRVAEHRQLQIVSAKALTSGVASPATTSIIC